MKVFDNHTYADEPIKVYFSDQANLSIGKFCSIAQGVEVLLGGNHRSDWISTYPFNVIYKDVVPPAESPISKGDVVIGNDVWLGIGVKILSGITIGDGAVVGAYSVVTKNVPPYTKVAGTPAKNIGQRFPRDIVDRLLKIQWWNWPEDKILGAAHLLQSADFAGLFEYYKNNVCSLQTG